MIEEQYVSFETAKLLKKKGFDIECYGYYDLTKNEDHQLEHSGSEMDSNDGPDCYISAPTQQMVMRWLREFHNIHIVIKCRSRVLINKANSKIQNVTEYYYEIYGIKENNLYMVCDLDKGEFWSSYEEAVEAAIKYCLENLINKT